MNGLSTPLTLEINVLNQLDSAEYGVVGTPAFNAEVCELANLLALVSQLCQKQPATSKGIIQAHVLQALKTLFGSKFIH